MSTLVDQLKTIQPCDDRNFIQIMSQIITKEVIELRSKACNRFDEIFTDYGLEGVRPCEILTEEFLEEIQKENTLIAINNLLTGAGFPPHIIQILTKGVDSLTVKQEQELFNWLLPSQGIRVHKDTARYVRYKTGRAYEPLLTQEEEKKVEDWYVSQGIQEIEKLLLQSIQEFITSKIKCPPEEKLLKLINLVNNIINLTNRTQETFTKLQAGVNVASGIVSILSNTIDAAKKIIAANDVAIAGATATGVGILGTPPLIQASAIVERQIRRYEPQIDALDKTLCAAAKTMQFINLNITVIIALLEVLDALLRACLPTIELSKVNTLTRDMFQGITYGGYTLEVRTVPGSSSTMPQRYAVALDEFGTVVLEGQRSYSASTQILVDEIKFRIDNQLG